MGFICYLALHVIRNVMENSLDEVKGPRKNREKKEIEEEKGLRAQREGLDIQVLEGRRDCCVSPGLSLSLSLVTASLLQPCFLPFLQLR